MRGNDQTKNPQLNVTIPKALDDDLHELWQVSGETHFRDFMERMLESLVRAGTAGVGGVPKNLDHMTEILADTVAKELKRNNRWAVEVALQARFHFPGESVFGERVGHYSKEKEAIAEKFCVWLVNRIRESYLKKGLPVCLVVDGGSTPYWIMRKIGEPLAELVLNNPAIAKNLSLLSINLPGVEAYMSFAKLDKRDKETDDDLLSYTIPCHILGGRVESRYAAVAAEKVIESLTNFQKHHAKTVFIGLVTGNWIRIPSGSAYPVPMWRDKGQGEFKHGLISICKEVYVVAPLAKVFVRRGIVDINAALGKARKQPSNYDDVAEAHQHPDRLRLVSTRREPGTLWHDHSVAVENRLDAEKIDDLNEHCAAEFSEVPSLLFSFSEIKPDTPRARQIALECPHLGTSDPAFMRWAYSVPAP